MSSKNNSTHNEENNNTEKLKLPKNHKLEDFDFHEFTADIANSITDSLYRKYSSTVHEAHENYQKNFVDTNIKNNLEVDDISTGIKEKIKTSLTDKISGLVSDQIAVELKEQYHSGRDTFEHFCDKSIKNIRWLMLPSFAFIALVLISYILVVGISSLYMIKETFEYTSSFLSTEVGVESSPKALLNNVVASILSILDLILIGTLIVMVLIGSYENTISRIGVSHEVPTWFGKLDIAQLKVKVAASIIIISSIHLLMSFMQLDLEKKMYNYDALMWTTIVHVVFVLSGIGLAWMDRINNNNNNSNAPKKDVKSTP